MPRYYRARRKEFSALIIRPLPTKCTRLASFMLSVCFMITTSLYFRSEMLGSNKHETPAVMLTSKEKSRTRQYEKTARLKRASRVLRSRSDRDSGSRGWPGPARVLPKHCLILHFGASRTKNTSSRGSALSLMRHGAAEQCSCSPERLPSIATSYT